MKDIPADHIVDLEKKAIATDGRLDLIEQKLGQMKEGFDHSRATGSKAWEAVAKLGGELATERTRIDGLVKDLDHCFEKIKRVETEFAEKLAALKDDHQAKIKAAQDTANTSQKDFKDINRTVLWGVLGSLIIAGISFGAVYLVRYLLRVGP